MKRRSILKSLIAAPAIPAAAQSQSSPSTPASEQAPKLTVAAPASAAAPVPRFFTREQFKALRELGDALAPASGGRAGATQAGAAEFLDFLVGQSPIDAQELYRNGLDRLAKEGVNEKSLAPLKEPWTYDGPKDPFARFLVQAKSDLLQATFNSREFAASASRGRRGGAGMMNYYWRISD